MDTIWEKISLLVWSGEGVNSDKIDDDGEVTDFQNEENENNFILFRAFGTNPSSVN